MLTVGIPTYDDFPGLQMTVQALLLYHDLHDVEIIVVDNHPQQLFGRELDETAKLRKYVEGAGGRYISMPDPVGTAAPRNRIFDEAAGDLVLVMDSHVMMAPKTMYAVREYFAQEKHRRDILTGPLLGKQREPGGTRLAPMATHYADVWRSEMWGIWSQAWGCSCDSPDALFDVGWPDEQPKQESPCVYYRVSMGREPITSCPDCGKPYPDLPYANHATALRAAGCYRKAWATEDPSGRDPFEITGMGLGMFAARREHWPGFPADMIGFGGGELHMHELYRRNGGRAVCHPLCGWWHRFERDGVPYPLQLWHKVRNYVLWRLRLGEPMDPVYQHFVADSGKISESQWQYLLEDPVSRTDWPAHLSEPRPRPVAKQPPKRPLPELDPKTATITDVFHWQLKQQRDCVSHLELIRNLASQCDTVVACVKRREWDVAVLAGEPRVYLSHNAERDPLQDLLQGIQPYALDHLDSLQAQPVPCDLLILDTVHSADRLRAELERWTPHVRKWIAIRGTLAFADKAEGRQAPGLMAAIRELCDDEGNEWKRIIQEDAQYGLTVLSCDPAERTMDRGPGWELHRIFDQLGVRMQQGCACRQRIQQMNDWGPEGCREHLDEIVSALKADQAKYSWGTQFRAALGTVRTGLAFRINPADPLRGLVKEAIRRTEAGDAQWAAKAV